MSQRSLLWIADPLLVLVTQLRATSVVADLGQLREKLLSMMLDFQKRARARGTTAVRVALATEVLSALLDHTVNSMPWGAEADWQSLLTALTPPDRSAASSQDGGRAAQRLLEAARNSSADVGMSELIGVALLLGFPKSSAEEPRVSQLLSRLTGADPKGSANLQPLLSPEGPSPVERGTTRISWLPLWVSCLMIAAVLAVLFFGLELSLGAGSDRLYARMAALNGPAAERPNAQPARNPRLAGPLSDQIGAGNILVRDELDRSVIVVPDARLFAAGSATLLPLSTEVLRPIAAALKQTTGRVEVIAHTDGTFARSARYPSDWDLSVDQARVVQAALRDLGVEARRLSYDGRATVEPAAAAERARGGDARVEIVLLVGR